MSFLKALFSSGESKVREIVDIGYIQGLQKWELKQFNEFEKQIIVFFSLNSHTYALFHLQALSYGDHRYDEAKTIAYLAELAPFLILEPLDSVKAYKEYQLVKQGLKDKCNWKFLKESLSKSVSQALAGIKDQTLLLLFIYAVDHQSPPSWFNLLYAQEQSALLNEFIISKHYSPGNLPQALWSHPRKSRAF